MYLLSFVISTASTAEVWPCKISTRLFSWRSQIHRDAFSPPDTINILSLVSARQCTLEVRPFRTDFCIFSCIVHSRMVVS